MCNLLRYNHNSLSITSVCSLQIMSSYFSGLVFTDFTFIFIGVPLNGASFVKVVSAWHSHHCVNLFSKIQLTDLACFIWVLITSVCSKNAFFTVHIGYCYFISFVSSIVIFFFIDNGYSLSICFIKYLLLLSFLESLCL